MSPSCLRLERDPQGALSALLPQPDSLMALAEAGQVQACSSQASRLRNGLPDDNVTSDRITLPISYTGLCRF
jgi:hypothetical protein